MIRQAGREKLEKQRSVEEKKTELPSGSPNAACTGMKPHQTKQIRAQSLLPARQPWNLSLSLSPSLALCHSLSPALSFPLHYISWCFSSCLILIWCYHPPHPHPPLKINNPDVCAWLISARFLPPSPAVAVISCQNRQLDLLNQLARSHSYCLLLLW